MDIIKIDLNNRESYQPAIEKAAGFLRKGGIVIFPTDTVCVLAASIFQLGAIRRIFKIKERPQSRPSPVLVKSIGMAENLAFVNDKTKKFLNKVWPGSVTIVLEKRDIISDELISVQKTVGLRMPNCQFVLDLIKKTNEPLAATSVNLSGQPSLNSSREITVFLKGRSYWVDLMIDGGKLPEILPSTIIDLTREEPMVLRQGPVKPKELLKIFNNLTQKYE